MTLEQLAILLELSRTHSMSVCAENLNMTKTNISKSISQLENELSARLFFKSRQGSFLTPLGEQVCGYAMRMLDDKKQIENLCYTKTPATKALNIMFTEAYAFIIPEITDSLRQKNLDTNILQLTSRASAHLNETIHYANPDVAFSTLLTDELSSLAKYEDDYYIYKINDEPLALMVGRDNLPEGYANLQISTNQLKSYSLLVLSDEVFTQNNSIVYSIIGKSFLEKNDLYNSTQIIQSNSLLLCKQYLKKPYYGLLCDPFSMKHSSLIKADEYVFLTIKPICSLTRALLINKKSPYFNFINEVIFFIQNRYEDDFPYLIKLNGTFGE